MADRDFTENEIEMQNIEAMRGECCIQIIAELKAGIDELCDELVDKYENHEVKEIFPGTMAALSDLKVRFTPEEIQREYEWNRYKEDYIEQLNMRMETVREDDGE